jgi:hypothetical protein
MERRRSAKGGRGASNGVYSEGGRTNVGERRVGENWSRKGEFCVRKSAMAVAALVFFAVYVIVLSFVLNGDASAPPRRRTTNAFQKGASLTP